MNKQKVNALIAKHIRGRDLPIKFLEQYANKFSSNTDLALTLLEDTRAYFEITPGATTGYVVTVSEYNGSNASVEHRELAMAICLALLRLHGVEAEVA